MSTVQPAPVDITDSIDVAAPIAVTFDALLEQLGPANETPDGQALPMVLEARPGGRWYRDLGDDNGHLWAFVQAVKRPYLLEFYGPLFMSSAAVNNVQWRLSETETGTRIDFRHQGTGPDIVELIPGMQGGWSAFFNRLQGVLAS